MDLIIGRTDVIKNLHAKQKLEVIFTASRKKEKSYYTMEGTLSTINGENLGIILPMTYRSWSPLLYQNRVVTVNFGRNNALFTFKSKITAKEIFQDFKLFLETPKVITKKERRQDERAPVNAPLCFVIKGFENTSIMHLQDKIGTGICNNIGRGGMNIITNLKLPIGLIMDIRCKIFDDQEISMLGKVARIHKLEREDGKYSAGIRFIKVEKATAEKIEQLISGGRSRFGGGISI